MVDRESLYLQLPVLLQHAACCLEGWRIQRSRFDSGFRQALQKVESRTFWTPEQTRALRDERLRSFVRHCFETVPYYRQQFRELGIEPGDISGLDDLHLLPILTKEQVQQQYAELLSEAVPEQERIITHTSGTTGGGLRFATTKPAIQEQWAIWWRYRRLHGIALKTWCGYFGGRSVVPLAQTAPPFWRYNIPGRQILFSAYHMSPETIRLYVEELRRRRPPWLHGYPSLIALLAGHLLDRGEELGYSLRWITTAAENLLPQQANLVERAFGIRPIEHYGMAEAVANCSQCPRGKLHVDEDFAAMELVPDPERGSYRIVGTNFTNLATPLLRYDVGDVAYLEDTSCGCGLPGRVVARIDGRLEDYVVLRNGARLGRMDHIFKDMMAIREAQIYQDMPGVVLVRIVRNEGYTGADEEQLRREFIKRVGDQAEIRFEYVTSLERSRTGKLRFVVSRLRQGSLVADQQSRSEHVAA